MSKKKNYYGLFLTYSDIRVFLLPRLAWTRSEQPKEDFGGCTHIDFTKNLDRALSIFFVLLMAEFHLGYPIIEVTGRFATTLFISTGVDNYGRPYPRMRDMRHRFPRLPFEESCQYFKLADWLYQQKGIDDIGYWRSKLKAPHMSTYDLWMKECLGTFAQSGTSPAKASISGGFTIKKLLPGGHWIAPTPDNIFNGKNISNFINPSVI